MMFAGELPALSFDERVQTLDGRALVTEWPDVQDLRAMPFFESCVADRDERSQLLFVSHDATAFLHDLAAGLGWLQDHECP
jgi:hypothetical protein